MHDARCTMHTVCAFTYNNTRTLFEMSRWEMKRSALFDHNYYLWFDPVFEQRKIHHQSDLISSLTVKVNDLSAVVRSIMGELELPDVSGASHLVRDMILVVAMGGITGAITLAQSASSVPEHFSDRISYIQNIVNIGGGKKFSAVQIQFLISLVDALPCSKDLLRQVSEKRRSCIQPFWPHLYRGAYCPSVDRHHCLGHILQYTQQSIL